MTPEPPAHNFIPTMGKACAVRGCNRPREQHDPNAPAADPAVECIVDHSTLQTRQFPTPQGLEWAHCRWCKVQLEAPANKRIG